MDNKLVAAPVLASEFSVCRRTIGRWLEDGALEFPKPVRIKGRLYFSRQKIEEWKSKQAGKTLGIAA
jgi:predicted DNA-binding transcriptional regulator AlpA